MGILAWVYSHGYTRMGVAGQGGLACCSVCTLVSVACASTCITARKVSRESLLSAALRRGKYRTATGCAWP